jgi:AbrB family looped-hinge helix DNA binding protein
MNTNPKSSSGERVRLACWLRCPSRNELCKAYGSPLLLAWAYALCNFQQRYYLTYFLCNVTLFIMNPTSKTDTVMFTVKGQVVIPRWLRKDFEINEGTRAVVYKQNDHIVLKPLTAQHYRRLRGSLKGTKAMEVFMSERKREREL